MATYVDPPSGWKYGFPKQMPEYLPPEKFHAWLVENGYPQHLIDQFPDGLPCGQWEGP